MWIGPFKITKIINKQNVEVEIKKRSQIYNVCRIKKFADPESKKFGSEESIKKQKVRGDNANLNMESDNKVKCNKAN